MQEKIDILIGKVLSGNASHDEVEELKQWRKQDDLNEQVFREAERVWQVSINLKKESDADVDMAWEEFTQLAARPQPGIFHIGRYKLQPLKIAAAVALFISTFFIVKFFVLDGTQPLPTNIKALVKEKPAPAPAQIAVKPDTAPATETVKSSAPVKRLAQKIRMITVSSGDSARILVLPDESHVYLNANSKITYPEKFAKNERRVTLEGEAYFDVVHDESMPFQVYCQKTISRVLGTSFNVSGYSIDKDVEVTVISGLVEVTGNETNEMVPTVKVLLAAGDSGLFSAERSTLTKSKTGKKEKWWKKANLVEMIRKFFSKKK